MSGLAVIYEQSNTPVDTGVLERVMNRLSHRGPDGKDVKVEDHVAMGHWHFWTTPEEVNEHQPLALAGLPFTIVLDGRLDNRSDLLSELGLNNSEGNRVSDSEIMLRAYDYFGEKCFEHFTGEYAVVIYDHHRNELLIARDALGDRTLFYSHKGTRLVISSEPWAVVGADESAVELDERAVAYYFAMKTPQDGQSLFKEVIEALPAQVMKITEAGMQTWQSWQPDPSGCIRGRTDTEYAEEFRSLLEESVRCRMRSTTPVGVLMSGGLDSTSVSCLAARMIAPDQLTTISYVFDELPDCDERKYIDMVKNRWHTRSIQIPCDDAWPWKDWGNWPVDPNRPEGNPYRLLKERAYARANQEGLRVLLTGGFGDHLYSAGMDWLVDMLSEGRLQDAGREYALYIRNMGLRWTLDAAFTRRVLRRKINAVPGVKGLHRKSKPPIWLTALSASYATTGNSSLAPVLESHTNLFGISTATSSSAEIRNSSRHTIDLRHPYRDRRLVEFVMKLPAYQLYFRGLYKHILRMALRGILPDEVLIRSQQTSLVSFYSRGIDREKDTLRAVFEDTNGVWRKYVQPEWLGKNWDVPVTINTDGPVALVNWLCTSFTRWYNSPVFSNRSVLFNGN